MNVGSNVTQEKNGIQCNLRKTEIPISGNILGKERLMAISRVEITPSAVSKKSRILELLWTKSPYSCIFVDPKQTISEKKPFLPCFLADLALKPAFYS